MLNEFHSFYIRIEETHANLHNLLKTQKESLGNVIIDQNEFEVLKEPAISHEFLLNGNDNCIIKEDQVPLPEWKTFNLKDAQHKYDEITDDPLDRYVLLKHKKLKEISKEALEKDNTKSSHTCNPDSEYFNVNFENTGATKSSLRRNKRKRKNPDEKTSQEYDKFISENFQIVCSLCQESLENFIALRKHFRDQHKKRGYVVCCKKKLFSRPLLVDHIHVHLDANHFKCKECEKVYSERSTLESHIKVHKDKPQHRYYSCETCGKSFVGPAKLETHKLTHAPDYEKKYSCSECGKL